MKIPLRTYITRYALILAIFCLPAAAAAEKVRIEGIVLAPSGPLADSAVYAYPDFASLADNRPSAISTPGEKPGQYRLELSPGSYYLAARGSLGGKHMFAYHGLNPVSIHDHYSWLPFFAVESDNPVYKDGPQGLGGRVAYRGTPLAGGTVSVYSLDDSSFRGMGLLSNTLDENGRFWFDLEPGPYVLVARKRQGNSAMGPLRKGDIFCYPEANPIRVLPGRSAEITVGCYPRDDLEAFLASSDLDPRGRREPNRRTASLWETRIEDAARIQQEAMLQRPAMVKGVVRDTFGSPRPGLYVSAYPADQFPLFQMFVIRLITDYITRADDKGRYELALESGRSYYLVAREKIGEAPDHLEYCGLYEGNANHSITVSPGADVLEADITVEPVMP